MPGVPELVEYPNFKISIDSQSTFATKAKLAHVDSFNFNDSFDVATVSDFDTVRGTIAVQIPTSRSITLSFDINLQPSDPAYQTMTRAYNNNTRMFLELSLADTLTTPNTGVVQLGGKFTARNITGQKPVATGSVTFSADELISDTLGG